ncbi:MAG: hypothetical protein E7172_06230 [Firmicutes bacterium]|nr:hypothetical protein [Bacillota bacterium]
MRKIKYFLCLSIFFLVPFVVNAASGKISVTGTSTVVVGNKVTITVTLSSDTLMGSWQMNLNYDKNYLQLTSSTAEASGTIMAGFSEKGLTSKKYTFTFKTLKTGSTNVSVGSYMAIDYNNPSDAGKISLSTSSKTVKIITQEELEASYSKDNTLKSLTVEGYELTPSFSKDTLEYSLIVPEDTKEITIDGQKNDNTATINGLGKFEVTQGTNTFEITVKAQNGSERIYKITIEVKDNNPINVTIEDENYTVVKLKENLPTPFAYQEKTITIDNFEIPAFYSEITDITLVGLKNLNGEVDLFIYKDDAYFPYRELTGQKTIIYPLTTDKVISNYEKTTININGLEIPAYQYNKKTNQSIIYGINIENGLEGFYIYDEKNMTFALFNDLETQELLEKIDLYTYIIIGFIIILGLMFVVIIILLIKNKKKHKNLKSNFINKEIKNT